MSSEHSEFREEFHGEHPHSYDRTEPKYSLVAILGGLTALLLIVVGSAIQSYYYYTEDQAVHQKVLSQPNAQLQELRNKEHWELTHYGVYDKNKGTFRLPIDQAMKLVEQEAAGGAWKFNSKSYEVKSAAQLAAAGGASQPGAAEGDGAQKQGAASSPAVQGNVQQSNTGGAKH